MKRVVIGLLLLGAGLFLAVGCTGPAGPPGMTGAQGSPGMTGVQGSPGMTGAQGSAGMTGVQGSAGMTGVQGPAGVTGAPGAPASPAMLTYRWSSLKEFMFDYDRSDIRYSESRKPGEVAAYMSQNPSVRLGHRRLHGYAGHESVQPAAEPAPRRDRS